MQGPLVGVLALQGAFEEHQKCLEAVGCRTVQVRTPKDLEGLDGIVLPGGESTAMGLIGTTSSSATKSNTCLWEALKEFCSRQPTWGTCAGMILLANQCVGTSAVIQQGQALIGGMDIVVCRNYFGSQISSFELETPAPPSSPPPDSSGSDSDSSSRQPYPGVFIRAPAILSAGRDVEILGRVWATPCRQAAETLNELERKLAAGEKVVEEEEEKKDGTAEEESASAPASSSSSSFRTSRIVLPGAADETNARQVICAVRQGNLLCTAFHPELTDDYRWHDYFLRMVRES